MAFLVTVSAEEKSILDSANVSLTDFNSDASWNEVAPIDGNFK